MLGLERGGDFAVAGKEFSGRGDQDFRTGRRTPRWWTEKLEQDKRRRGEDDAQCSFTGTGGRCIPWPLPSALCTVGTECTAYSCRKTGGRDWEYQDSIT